MDSTHFLLIVALFILAYWMFKQNQRIEMMTPLSHEGPLIEHKPVQNPPQKDYDLIKEIDPVKELAELEAEQADEMYEKEGKNVTNNDVYRNSYFQPNHAHEHYGLEPNVHQILEDSAKTNKPQSINELYQKATLNYKTINPDISDRLDKEKEDIDSKLSNDQGMFSYLEGTQPNNEKHQMGDLNAFNPMESSFSAF